MKVAFTSSSGEKVDLHFGHAAHFHVWDVTPDAATPLGKVSALVTGEDEEDRTVARASALAGCAIVYTVQVGGPAAAKLVARRIHPMKTAGEVPVAEVIAKLQGVLRGRPPPWLRKAMGLAPAAAAPAPDDEA
jgi:nitrogen fixation protein NifX